MIRILFVCTGNICRSPTAEGVARAMAARQGLDETIAVDSAGTHGYHIGEPPDRRSQAAAKARGYDLSDQRARRVEDGDYAAFDYLIALDQGHFSQLSRSAPAAAQSRVHLLMDFARRDSGGDVPDPYYGGREDFEHALDLIEDAVAGLLDHVRATHLKG